MKGPRNEVPAVRGVDACAGDKAQAKQREEKAVRVRQSASIRHSGVRRRSDWPFLYSEEGGRFYVNPGNKADLSRELGEALW
jgi:hypothetical protein